MTTNIEAHWFKRRPEDWPDGIRKWSVRFHWTSLEGVQEHRIVDTESDDWFWALMSHPVQKAAKEISRGMSNVSTRVDNR